MHANKKAPDNESLLHGIGIYLGSGEDVVGAKELRLLRDVDVHLREATKIETENVTSVATTKKYSKATSNHGK